MAKKSYKSIVTPALVAAFAYTEEPDTHFGVENAKHRISVKVPKDQLDDLFGFLGGEKASAREIVDYLLAAQKENGEKPGTTNVCRDGDLMKTKEGEPKTEMAGFWVLQAKSKERPRRVDSARNPLPLKVTIRGGDLVKVLIGPGQYTQNGGGLTAYVNEVMLIEKRSGGEIPAEEAGYVYEGGDNDEAAPSSEGAPADGDF